MGGASCRLKCTYMRFGALLKARSVGLKVACEERKKMATPPEEEPTTELMPLTPENEDYNPFSDEGKRSIQFTRTGAQGYAFGLF